MKFEKLGKQLDKQVAEAEVEVDKTKKDFNGLSKTSKYIIYGLIGLVVLGFGSCALRGCGKTNTPIQVTQIVAPVEQVISQQPQPVVVQQGSNTGDMIMAGALGYMIGQTMSNGQVFNGHNAPTKVVNNHVYYVGADSKTVDKAIIDKKVETSKPATPINQKSVDQKNIKKEADKVAETEKAKMKAEAEQKVKQEKLKADLKAKQTVRSPTPVTSKPSGGFKSFSKGRK